MDRKRVYLVSFPKCGRTWLRVLLGRVFQRHFDIQGLPSYRKVLKLHKLTRYHPDIPWVEVTHDDYPQWKRPGELEPDKSRYRDAPVAYLVRDPRDVVVSLYFEQSRRVGDYLERLRQKRSLAAVRHRIAPYEGTLSEFLREEVGSLETLLAFLDLWDRARTGLGSFLPLRYEDLAADPAAALRRVLDLYGVAGVSDDVVHEAVEFASFDNLRRLEREGAFRTHKLEPAATDDHESYKVRRGKIGGYVDYMSPEDVAWLEARMAEELSPAWGYSPCRQGAGGARSRGRTPGPRRAPRR